MSRAQRQGWVNHYARRGHPPIAYVDIDGVWQQEPASPIEVNIFTGVDPAATNLPPVQGLPDPSTLLPGGFQIPGLDPSVTTQLTTPLPASTVSFAYGYNQANGEKMLAALQNASGNLTLNASDFRDAMMTVLVHAELAAGQVGLAVGIPTGDADPTKAIGYVIGGAYTKAKAQAGTSPIAAAYVAAFDTVNAALASAHPAPDSAPLSIGSDFQQTVAPLVLLALVVVGIAAIAAGAYVAIQKITIDSDSAERVYRVDQAVALAKAGKPIPPGLIPNMPNRNDPNSSIGAGLSSVGTGLIALAVVGGILMLVKK